MAGGSKDVSDPPTTFQGAGKPFWKAGSDNPVSDKPIKKMEYITVGCNYCICEDSKNKEKNQGAFLLMESFTVDGVKGLLFIDRLKHFTSIKFTVPIDDPHPATDTMSVNGAILIYGI